MTEINETWLGTGSQPLNSTLQGQNLPDRVEELDELLATFLSLYLTEIYQSVLFFLPCAVCPFFLVLHPKLTTIRAGC